MDNLCHFPIILFLRRYQKRCDELEVRNGEFQNKFEKLSEDKKDIVLFIKKKLDEKSMLFAIIVKYLCSATWNHRCWTLIEWSKDSHKAILLCDHSLMSADFLIGTAKIGLDYLGIFILLLFIYYYLLFIYYIFIFLLFICYSFII